MQINQKNFATMELRRKYEMLRTMLLDERAKQYGRASQYSFDMGDQSVRVIGFFKYSGRIVNITNSEIERMGESLLKSPGYEMPVDFYADKIEMIECTIDSVKKKAEESKQPLNLIKRAFGIIKNAIFDQKQENNRHREGR